MYRTVMIIYTSRLRYMRCDLFASICRRHRSVFRSVHVIAGEVPNITFAILCNDLQCSQLVYVFKGFQMAIRCDEQNSFMPDHPTSSIESSCFIYVRICNSIDIMVNCRGNEAELLY